MQRPNLSRFGVLLVALGAATWATDTLLRAKLAQPFQFSPVALVLGEHLFLALYAIPAVILGWSEMRRLSLGQWAALLFVGWGGSALATVLYSQGFLTISHLFATNHFAEAASGINTLVLLQQTQPFFAIGAAVIFLKERLTWRYLPIFLAGIVGAYFVAFGTSAEGILRPFAQISSTQAQFAAIALAAALFWGTSTAMGKLLSGTLSFNTLTGARFLTALPFLLVIAFITVPNLVQTFGTGIQAPEAGLYLFLLALLPGLVGLLLYYRGLKTTPASYATLAELAYPVCGLLINAFVLHAPPSMFQIIGVLLVVGAVVIMNLYRAGVIVPSPAAGTAPASPAVEA